MAVADHPIGPRPHDLDDSRCSSCKRAIGWVILATSRKRHPIDRTPDDEGTVAWPWGLDRQKGVWLAKVVTKDEAKALKMRHLLYVSHFSTCPDAAKHRKRKAMAV